MFTLCQTSKCKSSIDVRHGVLAHRWIVVRWCGGSPALDDVGVPHFHRASADARENDPVFLCSPSWRISPIKHWRCSSNCHVIHTYARVARAHTCTRCLKINIPMSHIINFSIFDSLIQISNKNRSIKQTVEKRNEFITLIRRMPDTRRNVLSTLSSIKLRILWHELSFEHPHTRK